MQINEATKAMYRLLNYSKLMEVESAYLLTQSKNLHVNNILRKITRANNSGVEDLLKHMVNAHDLRLQLSDDSLLAVGAICERLLMFTPETIAAIETQIETIYQNSIEQ